jgi:hypothetical protein
MRLGGLPTHDVTLRQGNGIPSIPATTTTPLADWCRCIAKNQRTATKQLFVTLAGVIVVIDRKCHECTRCDDAVR